MIISIEKAFDIIQHPFMIKSLRKLRVERKFLNLINGGGTAGQPLDTMDIKLPRVQGRLHMEIVCNATHLGVWGYFWGLSELGSDRSSLQQL